MFSWGEDWQQGFRLKRPSNISTADGVRCLNLSFQVTDLSAGHRLLAFIKRNGDAYIIHTVESQDEGRVRGKQKIVKCEEKIEAVSCGEDVVRILSESGIVFCVDQARPPFSPSTPEALGSKQVSQVTCGSQHTVVLTKDGQLYTWGQDSRGQLGLGTNKQYVNSPQHVRSLSAIPVVQVAAGGEQSFALSVSGGVFSWGRNDCGQLGLGDTQDRHTPTLVHYLNMKKTVSISCGKDHTAALTKDGAVFTFGSGQYGQLGHNSLQNEQRPRLVAELWGAKVTKVACGSYHTLVLTESKKVYSFGCNEQGQLGRGEETRASVPLPVQLPHDISNIYAGGNTSFATCTPNEGADNESGSGTKNNVTEHSIDNMIAATMQRLPDASVQILGEWWSSLSPSDMIRYVQVWKRALSWIKIFKSASCNSQARNILLILQHMYHTNEINMKIPETTFCLEFTPMFLMEDLKHWRTKSKLKNADDLPVILCKYPFLMDLKSKKMVFDMNSAITQNEQQAPPQMAFVVPYGWIPQPNQKKFKLRVQRASLLESTFRELAAAPHSDFKKQLVVFFDGNYAVDDVNKKDFFYEVFHELMSVESGMFVFNDSKTLAWFSSEVTQDDQHFFLFGVLCGLALYNNCIIHLPFPLVLFKKLLDVRPSMEDLKEFSQVGEKEFVDAYVNHAFNTSVENVFQEFKRGFFLVCERDLVKLFRPKELQEVMVGKDFSDWEKLKQNTHYEGEYSADHPTIQMFWEVFDELTENQKKVFLWFVTGFDRVPILDMDKIKMQVKVKEVEDLSYDLYYPETHTCYTILELPLYSAKEIMQTKLTEALSNNKWIHK
ncbi:probable E3 ubiquitin-protein ligase HERC4 isoform X4 [Oreochromis niloticus]|uniref:probable E3 ubiquitin-protein ligase HERC4 isoform X4 n=1 Tax=Oreochromis niloticus TaxID=8128 RepID=UPI000DF1C2C3|nr:probable E3 ubiquitin-protein ligase HERC4 isoform X4 [Oreochromis niloticus]